MINKHKQKSTALYCFSPPVMLATFLVEISLLAYTLWRYKLTNITKLVVAILGFLAAFQLSEYMVCGGLGVSATSWARFGFMAITILPPLGVHLAVEISGKKQTALIVGSYAAALCFAVYFLVMSGSVERNVCGGNYIIFDMPRSIDWLYSLYYYGLLLVGVTYAWVQSNKIKNKNKSRALQALAVGYTLFMLPTTTVNLIDPNTTRAIPSIMCGFAVLLAFTVAFWVLPQSVKFKEVKKKVEA